VPRHVRLDAVGTLHHVIVRRIEKRRIVDDEQDRRAEVPRQLGVSTISKSLARNYTS
jgi:hypothetical protein